MVERAGLRSEEGDADLLLSYAAEADARAEQRHRFAILADSALQGFFHLAAEGHAFVSLDSYQEEFGDSLEANYPGAGAGFLRLARSYWTLQMLEGRLGMRYAGTLLQQTLLSVHARVGEAFFPAEESRDSGELARVQRSLVEQSGAAIDLDEMIMGNPLLVGNPLADD